MTDPKWKLRATGNLVSSALLGFLLALSVLIGVSLLVNAMLLLEAGENDKILLERGNCRSRIQRYSKLALLGVQDDALAREISESFFIEKGIPLGILYRRERLALQESVQPLFPLWMDLYRESQKVPIDKGKLLELSEEIWKNGAPSVSFVEGVGQKKKVAFIALALALLASLGAVGILLRLAVTRVRRGLESAAYLDPLTQLGNRRRGKEALLAFLALSRKHKKAFTLLMVDLDRFKMVNDQFGHDVGDHVLKTVARLFQEALRDDAILTRHGGEEFVILLPESRKPHGHAIAERLRRNLEEHPWPQGCPITASFGCTLSKPGDSPEAILKRADLALYESKENGRNCVNWSP